jgi:hypothetical protein
MTGELTDAASTDAPPSMDSQDHVTTGGCLCGRVRWRATGPMEAITACHCSQCRRQSGHFMAFSATTEAALAVEGADGLSWYKASREASRGFCATCGSHLFWRRDGASSVSIAAGSFDGATGLALVKHIFCADKGDYYTISDGVEQAAVV